MNLLHHGGQLLLPSGLEIITPTHADQNGRHRGEGGRPSPPSRSGERSAPVPGARQQVDIVGTLLDAAQTGYVSGTQVGNSFPPGSISNPQEKA